MMGLFYAKLCNLPSEFSKSQSKVILSIKEGLSFIPVNSRPGLFEQP